MKKSLTQILKFYMVLIFPPLALNLLIFLNLPFVPDVLEKFIQANIKENLIYLLAPAFIWIFAGVMYGRKKGYMINNSSF